MPPALAVAVAALTVPRFTSAQVGQVIHLTSKFAANTPDLEWMEGRVPTPNGIIHIRMERHYVCIRSDEGRGRLYLGNRCFDIEPNKDYHIPITSV